MQGVNVKSEIGNLKKVILHRPGDELLNLTPNTLEELLFDDITFLEVAKAEHDAFADILRGEGTEVVYLEELMTEVIDANPELREQFLDQWIFEAGIRTDIYKNIIKDYINTYRPRSAVLAGGGFIGSKHPHAGRFNAGQKGVFWMVAGFGAAMGATGLMMLFPFALVDVNGMQIMQVIHSLIGIVFIAGILAHIYIGTLGMKGAYDAMGSGQVDLAWARAHHDLWVEQEQARTASGPQLGSRPAPAE